MPDITVEVEFEDKTYRRKSAFSVMIEKILTDLCNSVELTRFHNFLGIDGHSEPGLTGAEAIGAATAGEKLAIK